MRFSKRNFHVIFLLVSFISLSCTKGQEYNPPKHVLDKHLEFSQYTNPGEFKYLYEELPESLIKLIDLIKKQLVHPFDIEKFGDKIPKDRVYEDRSIPTVSQMLKELLKRNKNGLVSSRQPEDRLVVACVHHCMLLASILRHRGIPVRIRAGYASYIGDNNNIRVSHVVCEVWDKKNTEWILVDPDRQRIDFPRHEFEFAFETWELLKNNNLNRKYYVSRFNTVDQATLHLLCHDLSYLIGKEEPYWNDPPIVEKIEKGITDLSKDELHILDKLAEMLKNADKNLNKLEKTQKETDFLKYSKEM